MAEKRKISLVLADVDGTLVTEEKVLTERAQDAVQRLREAPASASPSPAAGRRAAWPCCSTPLELDTPIAGFNGGLFVKPRPLDHRAEDRAGRCRAPGDRSDPRPRSRCLGLSAATTGWSPRPMAPHVAREAWTVKFEPKVVTDVRRASEQVAKIVGVSDDLDMVQRCEADAQAAFGERATANRSQPYYLDVTNKDANKGAVVDISRSTSACRPRRSPPSATSPTTCRCSSARASASPWAMPPTRSRRRPRRHGFLQRRRLRQGDGAFHSRLAGLRSVMARSADRDNSISTSSATPHGGLDDAGSTCLGERIPLVVFGQPSL